MIGGLFWMGWRPKGFMESRDGQCDGDKDPDKGRCDGDKGPDKGHRDGDKSSDDAHEKGEKMANNPMDTSFADKALHFAIEAHKNTERRGKGTPYVLHVFEAAAIVATITADQELIAAAALHDTLEDTEVSYEQVLENFGERVAKLVSAESETPVPDKSLEASWKERKEAAIARIASSSHDAKIVALGDKLSNIRAIYRDYTEQGDSFWNIFHNKDPKEHEWHYRSLAEALSELSDTAAYREFVMLIDLTFPEK